MNLLKKMLPRSFRDKYRNHYYNLQDMFKKDPDQFLKQVTGVIHVGANYGQERDIYKQYGLHVIWIEPIPEVYKQLTSNINAYSNQVAFQYLVTDKEQAEYEFHISNNNGASSSILDLKLHKDIWPDVGYDRTITLRSTTLTSLVKKEQINIGKYDALIMDTQGVELSILKGALPILSAFKFIKAEVPDFESYEGCCQLKDIDIFLKEHGFMEFSRHKFVESSKVGSYYDVVYKRNK